MGEETLREVTKWRMRVGLICVLPWVFYLLNGNLSRLTFDHVRPSFGGQLGTVRGVGQGDRQLLCATDSPLERAGRHFLEAGM